MTHRITKRPAAERDIEECFVHIAQENLDIGVTFLVALETPSRDWASFPSLAEQKSFRTSR